MNKVALLQITDLLPLSTPAKHVLPIQSSSHVCRLSAQRWESIKSYAAIYKPKGVSVDKWQAWKPFMNAVSLPQRKVSVQTHQLALWRLLNILRATLDTTIGDIFSDSSLRALIFQDMQTRDKRSTTAHVKRDIVAMKRGMLVNPYKPPVGTRQSQGTHQFELLNHLVASAPMKYRRIAVQVLKWVESTDPSKITPCKEIAQLRHWTRRKGFKNAGVPVIRIEFFNFATHVKPDPALSLGIQYPQLLERPNPRSLWQTERACSTNAA